jgi:hypothetical protein
MEYSTHHPSVPGRTKEEYKLMREKPGFKHQVFTG